LLTSPKTSFERAYRVEKDVKVKERMLLVLNVVYHGKVASQIAKDIHKSRGWAFQWLKRYDEEDIEGLKDKPKSGRRSRINEKTEYRIKTILKQGDQGWTTKQVEELIIQKTGIRYHYTHIYRILRKWGFKQKVPRKVHVNTASREEKEAFKKRPERYSWILDVKKGLP
jgi:putative transposase